MYIKGILSNSQDKLADLVHPQQDGTFVRVEVVETSFSGWKPDTLAVVLHPHCARFLLTFVERSFSIWRPDRAIALFRRKDFAKNRCGADWYRASIHGFSVRCIDHLCYCSKNISGVSLLLTSPDSIATIFNMSLSPLGTIRIAKCKY